MGAYFYLKEIKRDAKRDCMQQIRNYLTYIKTRRGRDCEESRPRLIFDAQNNDVKTGFIVATAEKQPLTQVSAFFVTLNPNALQFDCQRLVRYVFREYRIVRGVELDWFASIHNHTEHSHAHIIIMPTAALNSSQVVYSLDMHLVRYLANQWLGRHHNQGAHKRSVS